MLNRVYEHGAHMDLHSMTLKRSLGAADLGIWSVLHFIHLVHVIGNSYIIHIQFGLTLSNLKTTLTVTYPYL